MRTKGRAIAPVSRAIILICLSPTFWAISLVCLLPTIVLAGGHTECNFCHLDVAQGNYRLVKKPNYHIRNPFTGKRYGRSDALCMNCHRPFKAKSIHPVGIVPQTVELPPEAKGFVGQEEEISCFSCHDPHPQNKNYMYLRWPSNKGVDISKFCVAKCHSGFAKPSVVLKTSMRN